MQLIQVSDRLWINKENIAYAKSSINASGCYIGFIGTSVQDEIPLSIDIKTLNRLLSGEESYEQK